MVAHLGLRIHEEIVNIIAEMSSTGHSSDPFHIVNYYIKRFTTSWTYSKVFKMKMISYIRFYRKGPTPNPMKKMLDPAGQKSKDHPRIEPRNLTRKTGFKSLIQAFSSWITF